MMDSSSLAVICIGILLLFIVLFRLCVVIVPARRFCIVERMGSFKHVCMPGLHFKIPFVDSLKSVNWSYVGQNNNVTRLATTLISFDNAQMDLPPLRCLSKDQIQVTVDATLIYNISKPQVAVYETDDVLSMFYNAACQGIRNTVSELPIADLQGKDNELGERVKLYINEKTTSKGVLCSMFLVQGVQIDKKILEANQQIYVRARQAKMAIEEQEAEHRKTLLMLAQRAEKEKAERAIEQENALHRHQLAEGAARAQAENERIKYQVLTSLGLSVENIIELEQIRAMQAIASSNNKVVYAPLPFFAGATPTAKTFPVD